MLGDQLRPKSVEILQSVQDVCLGLTVIIISTITHVGEINRFGTASDLVSALVIDIEQRRSTEAQRLLHHEPVQSQLGGFQELLSHVHTHTSPATDEIDEVLHDVGGVYGELVILVPAVGLIALRVLIDSASNPETQLRTSGSIGFP